MVKKTVKWEVWDDHEIFTSKGRKLKNPWITITDRSAFHFNAAFVHQAKITKSTHVIFGFSSVNNAITFQFTSDSQAEGVHTLGPRASSAESRAFFNHHFLDVNELAGRYVPKKVKLPRIGELWAIDLDNKLPEK